MIVITIKIHETEDAHHKFLRCSGDGEIIQECTEKELEMAKRLGAMLNEFFTNNYEFIKRNNQNQTDE